MSERLTENLSSLHKLMIKSRALFILKLFDVVFNENCKNITPINIYRFVPFTKNEAEMTESEIIHLLKICAIASKIIPKYHEILHA